MVLKVADRIKQLTTSTGTGDISFSATPTGFSPFSSALTNGDTTYYCIEENDKWEVGVGTYGSDNMVRSYILASSNNGNAINLGGSGTVFITYPAGRSTYQDEQSRVVIGASGIILSNGTVIKEGKITELTDVDSSGTISSTNLLSFDSTQKSLLVGDGTGPSNDNNTIIGYGAASGTTGSDNTVVGTNPFVAGNGGIQNVSIGVLAGPSEADFSSSASYGVSVGYKAGSRMRSNSTAVGHQAGIAAYEIGFVAIGSAAGSGIGSYSVAVGNQAADGMNSDYVVSVGYQAGKGAAGESSVWVGNMAGISATSASKSIGIGHQAGKNSSANDSIYIGQSAGQSNSSNDYLYIGNGSPSSNRTLIKGDMQSKRVAIGAADVTLEDTLYVGVASSVDTGLVIKGAVSQSANLTEWQNSAGVIQAKMASSGILGVNGVHVSGEGILIDSSVPTTAANSLYNVGGTLYWNLSPVGVPTGIPHKVPYYDELGRLTSEEDFAFDSGNATLTVGKASIGDRISVNDSTGRVRIGRYVGDDGITNSNFSTTLGYQAATNASGATGSTIAGFYTAYNSIDLSYSQAVGYFAGINASGERNTYIGEYAGGYSSGTYNTFIGHQAGRYCKGSQNIEILASGAANSVIDNYSNKLHIGNTIIGDTSNKKLAIGNVSASNVTPDATLEILPKNSSDIGVIVQGAASQSANLQEWQASNAVPVVQVSPEGNLSASGTISASGAFLIDPLVPSVTTNKLYNDGGTLKFNGSVVGADDDTYISGVATYSSGVLNGGIPTFDDVNVKEYIYHDGDTHTYIRFRGDQIDLVAGNLTMLTLDEAGTDMVTVNIGGNDIDFQVEGENDANLIRTDAANDKVGIGTSEPAYKLDVFGHDAWIRGTGLIVGASGIVFSDGSTQTTAGASDTYASGIAAYASGQAIENETAIATNTSNISTNTSNISTNSGRITYASGQAIQNEIDIAYVSGAAVYASGSVHDHDYVSGVAAYASGNTITTQAIANYASGQAIENEGLVTYASGNTANISFGSNAEGDMLFHNGTTFVRLAKGADDYILKMNGNQPNWEEDTGGGGGDVTTAQLVYVSGIAVHGSGDAVYSSGIAAYASGQAIANETDIATNTSNISTNTTNIATNTSRVAYASGQAIDNETDIAYVSGVATYASGQAIENEGLATYASGQAIENETAIATNTSNISTNTTNITTNTARVTYASGQAIDNETDLVYVSGIANYASGQAIENEGLATYASGQAIENETAIATNTSNISTNTSNISTNTARVNYASGQAIQNETDIAYTSGIATYASGNTIVNDGLIAYASGNTANISFGSNAEGDLLYHDGTSFVRLAKGTDNYILKMNGNVPNWEAESSGGDVSAADFNYVSGVANYASGNTIATQDIAVYASGSAAYASGLAITNLIEDDSIYIGNDPSSTTSTAERNIAIGSTALDAVTTADDTIAIGYNAGTAITANSSSKNILIGSYAGENLTTNSDENVFIGYEAGHGLADYHVGSVVIGYHAGYSSSDDRANYLKNVSIGHQAGMEGNCQYSVHIGPQAGEYNAGNGSVAIGDGALKGTSSTPIDTYQSVAIGENSGSTSTGDYCVYLGRRAGYANTSDKMLFIGWDTPANSKTIIKADMDNKHVAVGVADVTLSTDPATLQVYAAAATDKVLLIRGAASQSDDLTSWQNSAGAVVGAMTPSGVLNTYGVVASGAGVRLHQATPTVTTDTLYNVGGTLYFDGSSVGGGTNAYVSGVAAYASGNTIATQAVAEYASGNTIATQAVELTAGDGLTGGGTLASDRTFAVGAGNLIDVQADQVDVDLTEAAAATIAHGDNLIFLDGGATGAASKGSTDDLAGLLAGDGLTKSNSVMAVNVDDSTIETNSDAIRVKDNGITLAKMAGLARGKIIYGDSSGDPAALALGTANQVLTSDGTDVAWADNVNAYLSGVAAYSSGNTIVNDGLIAYASGNTANIAFGSNAEGDLLYHDGTSFVRLAKGTDNYILKMNGNVPNWEAESGGGGGMTNFTLAGDGGSNQTIADGNTLTVAGGNGITTTGAATDTVSIAVDAAQTTITSLLATDIKIGEDDQTKIDFETEDEIHFYANNVEQVYLADNIFGPQSDSDVDLGTTGVRWKDAYVDSITVTGEIDGDSLDIEGDADINGTTNLDAVDIDGNVQLDGTLTVGVDDTGQDVKFFGATSGAYALFDESEDRLHLVGVNYVQEAVPANDTPTAEDATVTLDLKKGNFHNISLGNNVTKFEFTNAKRGQRFILRITQNGSSAKTVSWSNVDSDTGGTAATVRWAGNVTPTMSTSTAHTDVYGFLCTNNAGTAFDGFIIGQDLPD